MSRKPVPGKADKKRAAVSEWAGWRSLVKWNRDTQSSLLFWVTVLVVTYPLLPAKPYFDSWSDSVLSTLSLEEKVGQMILARSDGTFLNENDPDFKDLLEAVRLGRAGGVVFLG